MERFTRRAPSDWIVPIPHRDIPGGNAQVKTIANPRRINFFTSAHFPIYFEGCSVNELGKLNKGRADKSKNYFTVDWFDIYDRNEVFDDGILKYRKARAENFSLESDERRINRTLETLTKILSAYVDGKVFDLETALTCRALSNYLREKILEEVSLGAILKSCANTSSGDILQNRIICAGC